MLDEYEKARQRYEQGLEIYREIKARLGEANCLQSLGDVHLLLAQYEKASEWYEQALSLQKQILDHHGMLWSYFRLGLTFEALKKYKQAEQNYNNSIDKIEQVREGLKREQFKTSFFASKQGPYEAIIDLLFNLEKQEDAFSYAERSKARAFLYLLGNKKIDPKLGIPQKLVRKEAELREEITSLTTKIMENEKREENRRVSSDKMKAELFQLKQEHTGILQQIKLNSPEYASLKSVNPLQVKDIQALIRNAGNTVLIQYYTTFDAAYLWLLDGKNIHPYKIDIKKSVLNNKIHEFRTLAADDTFGVETLAGRARELYDLLLKPAARHLEGKSRIAVIPHGYLHYLPFEALMKNGKFLIEQNIKLFYLPSASIYKYCKEKNHLKKEQLIGIGNPDGTLPFSEKEVEELKQLYTKDTEIFTGEEASEYRIKKEYSPYPDILHFACHGSFNAAYPLYSALILAPNQIDDGRLEVQEIFQLKLKPAYLVTLSACETHLGGIQPGDEIIGLTRAFIYAGTPSILASLWKVDDYYTSKLMVAFYRALKNTNKIDALHTARKTMIEVYGKRHPYYWAAFVLIGDYR
jgi:CHAT domain-containing protein